MRCAIPLRISGRLRGTVASWHPFERRGVIHCEADGKKYVIPNARAFETILPTRLRQLEGATVEFEAICTEQDANRVITRSRLEQITAKSYGRTSPVDFLACFRLDTCEEDIPLASSKQPVKGSMQSPPLSSSDELIAGHITVDLSTVATRRSSNARGDLVNGELKDDAATEQAEDEEEEGVRPPAGIKDLRNPAVLDQNTRELLRLRRHLGDDETAREALQRLLKEREISKARQRRVLAPQTTGVVIGWSSLHRSGVVLENATEITEYVPESNMKDICIIRNVDAFDTALPTDLNLVGRLVTFVKVAYTSHPSKQFAENISVCGKIDFNEAQVAVEEAKTKEAAAVERAKRAKQLGTLYEEEIDYDNEPVPTGILYGVVTRWSGGQGIVETGNRRLYYIQSAADFKQLFDQTSNTIRGAVVSFIVDNKSRRNAREINILSLSVRDPTSVMPIVEREAETTTGGARDGYVNQMSGNQKRRGNNDTVDGEGEKMEPADDSLWVHGILITWSPSEDQGVIQGDDGNRYLIRDGDEHVRDYKTSKQLLKKGRCVKFTPFGGTGLLACHVIPLDTEADEATLAEAELHSKGERLSGGHAEEAIASPMSTSYWISRMDKAGYDTAEVKKMQNKALTFDDDDDDDVNGEKLLDSEDLFKKDHWFNDPRKNMRLPNSDMTAGHLALIGPASMMNIAMKARNPQKLEKVKNKYYNRLTEPMKEFAWKQARELAPKYEKRIKEAREKGEEPRFSFY